MAIVIPSFTTSAVINGSTLISQADEQLNVLMNDMKTYAQNTYSLVQNGLIAEMQSIIDDVNISLNETFSSSKITQSLPKIGFDMANVTAPSTGQFAWNQDEGTLDLGLSGSTLQLGQEFLVKVRASTNITNGQVVMVNGTVGNSGRILVVPHDGTKANAKRVLGVATSDITSGADGFITVFGKVRSINTTGSLVGETWVDGDVLYIKPNDSGNLTKIVPTDSELSIPIAYVIHAHNAGTLFIRTTPTDDNAYKDYAYSKAQIDALLLTINNRLTALENV